MASAGPPTSLFDAAANDDLQGMVDLYAATALDAIVSYMALRRRWGHRGGGSSSRRGSFPAEEKLDEYFQQHRFSSPNTASRGQRQSADGVSSYGGDTIADAAPPHYYADSSPSAVETMLKELNTILIGRTLDQTESMNRNQDENIRDAAEGGYEEKGSTSSQHPAKKTRQSSSSAPLTESLSLIGADDIRLASEISSEELERVVWESAALLTNSRPPSSFAVFQRDNEERLRRRHETPRREHHSGSDGNPKAEGGVMNAGTSGEIHDNVGDEGPPLFDGSVANATPGGGPISGTAGAGGGGSGTVLHLACALDSPFVLAAFLAMGADASSRHTAFRRMMVHEAACANSPDCLRLLLELGKKFGDFIFFNDGEGQNMNVHMENSTKAADGGRYPIHGLLGNWSKKSKSNKSSTSRAFVEVSSQMDTDEKKMPASKKGVALSFISTLRKVLDLGQDVLNGSLSDIEAARSLLSRVELSSGTKAALISSCYPIPQDQGQAEISLRTLNVGSISIPRPPTPRPMGNADGHGNTPLHWAAFKNASDCVAVLLSHGVDPDARAEPSGWTPLHDAAYSDAAESLSLLIAAGVNVDVRANSGATPLCFAAQEDAPDATGLLLEAGADATVRCCGHGHGHGGGSHGNNASQSHQSRFSGYTPLHYCAHYNAYQAAKVLLEHEYQHGTLQPSMLEIPDLNEKLPIHVAVARGSSDVLRELLHGGARVDTTPQQITASSSPVVGPSPAPLQATPPMGNVPQAQLQLSPASSPTQNSTAGVGFASTLVSPPSPPAVGTPVSSPILRAMIPSRPVNSSKPWNCLTQQSIDECRTLIREAELNWSPERHALFHPADRRAVVEVLRVGKRLEQMGTGIFAELWPCVLSFCGRGWFEPKKGSNDETETSLSNDFHDEEMDQKIESLANLGDRIEDDVNSEMGEDGGGILSDEDMEFTQFRLDD